MAVIVPFPGQVARPEIPLNTIAELAQETYTSAGGVLTPFTDIPPEYLSPQRKECFFGCRVHYKTMGGIEKNRLGFIGKLDPFTVKKRDVIPLVETPPQLVERTLKEIQATRRKSGLLVAAYEDPQFEIEKFLTQGMISSLQVFDLPESKYTLWPIENEVIIDEIVSSFTDKKVFLFDGAQHFKAARHLRNRAQNEDKKVDEKQHYPLTLFLNIYDFGVNLGSYQHLAPLPPTFDINRFILACDPFFDAQIYHWNSDEEREHTFQEFQEDLRIHGTTEIAIGACFSGIPQFFLFTLKQEVSPDEFLPVDLPDEMHQFSIVFLKHFFIEQNLWKDAEPKWNQVLLAQSMKSAFMQFRQKKSSALFFLPPPNKKNLLQLAKRNKRVPFGAVRIEPPMQKGLVSEPVEDVL